MNSPDWEWPKSTLVAGLQAGYATVDVVRAALASGSVISISPSAKVQMLVKVEVLLPQNKLQNFKHFMSLISLLKGWLMRV